MRTLIVASAVRLPGQHGGSTHVRELAEHLRAYGPVLTLAQRGSAQVDVVGVGFTNRAPRWLRRALIWLELPAALAAAHQFKPDVIYERGSSYGLGALLSQILRVPLLCMVLDEHYTWRSLRQAHTLISTTADTVPQLARHKFVKVGWGANAQLFNPATAVVDQALLAPFAGLTVGYVGSFKNWHGLLDLVPVAQQLAHIPLRFVLVGDGPLRPALERSVHAAGLQSKFVFAGQTAYETVPHWIAAFDVCIAPFLPTQHSPSERGFVLDPLKIFEYLAMGKATLTVDSPNLRALFTHEQHLLLIRAGDVAGYARALQQLHANPAQARLMAERGRQRVLARHTWAAHAEHLHQLFTRMLAHNTRVNSAHSAVSAK